MDTNRKAVFCRTWSYYWEKCLYWSLKETLTGIIVVFFLMMDCVLIRIALLFTVCYGFSCWFMDQQAYPLPEMLMCACSLPTWYPSFPAVPCRWNQSHSNVRIGRIIKWKITWIDSTPLEDAPDCHWSAVFWNILKQGLHIVSSAIVYKCMFGLWYLLSVWLSRSRLLSIQFWHFLLGP